jgi:hypothetical protein
VKNERNNNAWKRVLFYLIILSFCVWREGRLYKLFKTYTIQLQIFTLLKKEKKKIVVVGVLHCIDLQARAFLFWSFLFLLILACKTKDENFNDIYNLFYAEFHEGANFKGRCTYIFYAIHFDDAEALVPAFSSMLWAEKGNYRKYFIKYNTTSIPYCGKPFAFVVGRENGTLTRYTRILFSRTTIICGRGSIKISTENTRTRNSSFGTNALRQNTFYCAISSPTITIVSQIRQTAQYYTW